MRLSEVEFNDAPPIDGYGPGFFRIAGEVQRGAVILDPRGSHVWAGYDDLDHLIGLAGEIDVLFIGTGAETRHVPSEFREKLEAAGLGVEAMASPAACRTYNVLLSEGRHIAAALLPI